MSPRPVILTLSRKRRRVYFQMLTVVFVLVVPILFLYATGYRFERVTGLTKTGGIYVGAEEPGTEIYLNGELVRETGTFRRAFYIQDLDPGVYTVTVSKALFHPWGKTLTVYEHIVTEAQAFNVPEEPLLERIPSTVTNRVLNATSTRQLVNADYTRILAQFATTTDRSAADVVVPFGSTSQKGSNSMSGNVGTGTVNIGTGTVAFRGMQLSLEDERINARWMRNIATVPFYFCIHESECVAEIMLNTKDEKPLYFDFFPGTTDLAMVTLKDGVYVTELDNRSGQNIQPLYLAVGADFRLIDGSIYVKTADDIIYKVEI